MEGVVVHRLGQVQHAAAPEIPEVVQRRPPTAGRGIEQRSFPQGVAGDDQLVDAELPHRLLEHDGSPQDDVGPVRVHAGDAATVIDGVGLDQ